MQHRDSPLEKRLRASAEPTRRAQRWPALGGRSRGRRAHLRRNALVCYL
jgi:hypothetical protein